MYQLSWGSYSVNDVSALIGLFFGDNKEDYSGDAQLHEWLASAEKVVDPEKRRAFYRQAIERITDKVYWLPISTSVKNYAFADDVQFTPSPDELIRLYTIHWK